MVFLGYVGLRKALRAVYRMFAEGSLAPLPGRFSNRAMAERFETRQLEQSLQGGPGEAGGPQPGVRCSERIAGSVAVRCGGPCVVAVLALMLGAASPRRRGRRQPVTREGS
jgi:hypothetical protein